MRYVGSSVPAAVLFFDRYLVKNKMVLVKNIIFFTTQGCRNVSELHAACFNRFHALPPICCVLCWFLNHGKQKKKGLFKVNPLVVGLQVSGNAPTQHAEAHCPSPAQHKAEHYFSSLLTGESLGLEFCAQLASHVFVFGSRKANHTTKTFKLMLSEASPR